MEASARGATEAGGDTIGITTKAFPGKPPNEWIDTVVATDSLVERLLKLISTADAYIVLKGGTGTLLELAAVWEFMNKTMMDEKPIIVIGNFWNEVVRTLNDELAWEGLENCTKFVTRVADPAECAKVLEEKFSAGGEWKR
jgi:uncharacterized protein (TIGR00725 family)